LKTQKQMKRVDEEKPKPTPKLEDNVPTLVAVLNPEEEKKEPAKPEQPVQKLDKFFVKMEKKESP
jgi:hypothetical protein